MKKCNLIPIFVDNNADDGRNATRKRLKVAKNK